MHIGTFLIEIQADNHFYTVSETSVSVRQNSVLWVAQHYKSGSPITLLDRPIPKLTDAATWRVWRQRLLYYYTAPALRDAAQYLYCATKDF